MNRSSRDFILPERYSRAIGLSSTHGRSGAAAGACAHTPASLRASVAPGNGHAPGGHHVQNALHGNDLCRDGTVGALAQSPAPAPSPAPAEVVKDLAPTGTLRAAINAGNVVLVQKDENGAVRGITVDLARELARRLGIPIDLHVYETAGKVTDAVKTGEWDIGFIAIEPVRAAQLIGFTAPYVIIEGTYMVGADSPLKSIADVDHDGVRIAVAKGSAYDLFLTRTLQHATLVHYPSPPLALQGFVTDKTRRCRRREAAARPIRQSKPECAGDGRPLPGHQTKPWATPLGRDVGLKYLHGFVEEMKASGFVKSALERAGQPGDIVAPAAN